LEGVGGHLEVFWGRFGRVFGGVSRFCLGVMQPIKIDVKQ